MGSPFGHRHSRHGCEDDPPPTGLSYVHHTSHVGGREPHPPPFGYPTPPEVGYVQHPEPHNRPSPPPPSVHHPEPEPYGRPYPPPPAVYHPEPHGGTYPPPPAIHQNEPYGAHHPSPAVHHVSHESYQHGFQSNTPDVVYKQSHPHLPEISNRPTVRVFCKAGTNHSLSIRNGKVILAPTDLSDEYQHWIKDEKLSTKVKDEEGLPSFALVNKVTGEAIKHSIGATQPVQLTPYNPSHLDESILWTESKDTGDGYKAIRMVNNIRLNMDAFHGDEDHGGVHDGTTIVLWEWTKGKNQKWKIIPY
ncbi:unnamed protein product [Cuscuta epithymum]|uniref:Uncharacterized protein n=1 Tax=Cuscuta epithymum TaxID=186058 RepID=A0AAV0DY14_9ASTE|nr:unnamed protein product [Cuscuta epithymum]